MKQGFVKAAAIAPKIKVADPVFNAGIICEELEKAIANKAKLIVFPELSLTGYTCGDLFLQQLLLDRAAQQLMRVVDFTKGMDALVFIGLPVEKDGKIYNVAAAVCDGKLLGMVPKANIPSYAEFYENRHFAVGNREAVNFRFCGQNIPFGTNLLFTCDTMPQLVVGCEICEDLWVASSPGVDHALMGATVLTNLSASNETIGKGEYRELLVKSASARQICGYVFASAGEGESTQDLVFGGHCMIAENGRLLARGRTFEAQTLYGDIDIQKLLHDRRKIGSFGEKPAKSYLKVPFSLKIEDTPLEREYAPLPFVPVKEEKRRERCQEILSIQAYGLKKRLEHIGTKKIVIGLSGGLDSTLALLVAVRTFDLLALDRKGIVAVTMPCFGTTGKTRDNACRLAESLKVTLREINITDSVRTHFAAIGQDESVQDVTYENAQARERTQVLMDLSNKENGIVIGTGDLSELALGWATYNGDHMSMYGVNSGVPKTLVRYLVSYCAESSSNRELSEVLQDILDTPVSPELLPPVDGVISQRTEDIVGPYELHDFFLYHMCRNGFSPAKIYRIACLSFAGKYEKQVILKWLKVFYRRFFGQQFKRSCLPDGPKVGSVALSPRGDFRMPSDAAVRIWMDEIESL